MKEQSLLSRFLKMVIKNIYLENFRNYENQKLSFDENKNVFYGANGQGKTNVIEAIYYFCTCKSFRSNYDREVIKFGKDFSHIRMDFVAKGRDNTADIYITDKKSVKVNGVNLEKLSELIGITNMVIFTPEHLNLIKDGPGIRRNFLDVFISQIKPNYFNYLINYYKVLKQRNNVIKNKKMISTIDVWNEKLSEYGVLLCKYRDEALKEIDKNIKKYQSYENLDIVYNPSVKDDFSDKENFIKKLELSLEKDIEKGITLIGPHRDDFDVLQDKKSLRKYGSQGQTRSAVLKIKLAECEIIKNITGEEPVLLLDDVLSELDKSRREYFTHNIHGRQVIITCTDKNLTYDGKGNYFYVEEGKAEQIF